uniref:Uncharacterized protein n=1 Tax=Chrysemys picta bellii TaxID=8478 RepID=A0A8C3F8W7_CHRPI
MLHTKTLQAPNLLLNWSLGPHEGSALLGLSCQPPTPRLPLPAPGTRGSTRHGVAPHGPAQHGMAWHRTARPSTVWRSTAQPGPARPSTAHTAQPGTAWPGPAQYGVAPLPSLGRTLGDYPSWSPHVPSLPLLLLLSCGSFPCAAGLRHLPRACD